MLDASNQAIAFANIVLTDGKNQMQQGTITDDKGRFQLTIKKGKYQLQISFLGYKNWTSDIELNSDKDLGAIVLEESANKLSEVEITAKKPLIERKVDRLVFNVENSIAASGGNALDALSYTPRITIRNNQIRMIGKGNIAVMINDKLVQLSGEELSNYLKTLASDNIKSIEVISNPPAKYSAEGITAD